MATRWGAALGAAMMVWGCGSEAQVQESSTEAHDESAGSMNQVSRGTETEPVDESPVEEPPAEEPPAEVEAAREAPPQPPSMEVWAGLLSRYQTEGGFRYAALAANEEDKARLRAYVDVIGAVHGLDEWSRDERLAFYINAYNVLTIQAVVSRWPIESVMRVEGFFDAITHQVAGSEMTLNHLENEIIRGQEFAEPRIHFAVNCASRGCPPLRAEPFAADTLDQSLEEQATAFVRATTQVRGRRASVTKLFEWFADDFGGLDGVRAFLNARLEEPLGERVRLRFADYDWAVNAAE